ncbi:MAG: type II secretion system F family protein [Firmicutes bacterium]|nr:type II secretion system F family protein [Bacillota bacterium]
MKQLKLSWEQVGALCRALAHLYHAGIGVGDALALLAEDESSSEEKALLSAMSRRADEGIPLSEIFRETGCFPGYVSSLLGVGEKVGRTEETLTALADHYEGRSRMACQLKNTLLYPSVLLIVLLAVIVILLVWVLPVFSDIYARLGSDMTGLSGGLLLLGQGLGKVMPLLVVILALILIFGGLLAGAPSVRERILSAWRKRCGDKGLGRMLNAARFTQALSMGIASGLSHREAVLLAADLADGSETFKERCERCITKLEEGCDLSEALRDTELLSAAECRLLGAGLKSGAGEKVMEQISQRALEESEQSLESLAGRVEPAIVVIMSVIVGVILLSVMLPLMHIMTAIG